jgi:hypothetical protein
MCIRTYSPVPPVNSCGNARDRSLLPSPRTSITCSKINGTKPPPGRCSRGRLQTSKPHHKQGARLAPQRVARASRHETSNGLEAQRQWNRDTSGAAAGDNAMGGGGACPSRNPPGGAAEWAALERPTLLALDHFLPPTVGVRARSPRHQPHRIAQQPGQAGAVVERVRMEPRRRNGTHRLHHDEPLQAPPHSPPRWDLRRMTPVLLSSRSYSSASWSLSLTPRT